MTRAQDAVVSVLSREATFLSAQEVHARLRTRGSRVGLTSVYRALGELAAAGELDTARNATGEAAYRLCTSRQHHHHLTCVQCGATIEIAAPTVERWVRQVAQRHGYAAEDHTVEISGRCPTCRMR